MFIYDLVFTDGKSCRYIAAQPEESEEEELRVIQDKFCGRLASMTRIIEKAPTKLPWRRQARDLWTCNLFVLTRLEDGQFRCEWPGGEAVGDKEEISAAVRLHWAEALLT